MMTAVYVSIFCLIFVASVHCDDEPSCFVEGRCGGTVVSTEAEVYTKYFCLQLCQRNPDCQWFTFDGSGSSCILLADCPTLDETCTECQTGESSCKVEFTKMLVVGGSSRDAPWNTVEIIDVSNVTSTCDNLPDFPFEFYGAVGGLGYGGLPLVCGGFPMNRLCHVFRDGQWVGVESMSDDRDEAGGVASIDPIERFIVTGGRDTNYTELKTGEVLTKTGWKSLPELPYTRSSHCMTYRNDETLMAIGGIEDNLCCSRSVHILDKENQNWIEGPPLQDVRGDLDCGRIKSDADSNDMSVIVPGGYNGALATVEILDQEADSWRYGPELPIGIFRAAVVEDTRGGVLVVGGASDDEQYLSSIFYLSHARAEDWSELPQRLKARRNKLTAFMVPDEITNCH